jgi:hypothetical protein
MMVRTTNCKVVVRTHIIMLEVATSTGTTLLLSVTIMLSCCGCWSGCIARSTSRNGLTAIATTITVIEIMLAGYTRYNLAMNG